MSNETKSIILIDMDGVVCHWVRAALAKYREKFPDLPCPKEEDIDTFYLEDSWPEGGKYHPQLHEVLNAPGFYRSLEPVEGAIDALKDLQYWAGESKMLEPFLCSSPWNHAHDLDCHSDKARWVEQFLGRWWLDRLVLTKDKTLVRGHILIDDKPEIKGVMQPTWQHLLYSQPWNRSSDKPRFTWKDWPTLRDSILSANIICNN